MYIVPSRAKALTDSCGLTFGNTCSYISLNCERIDNSWHYHLVRLELDCTGCQARQMRQSITKMIGVLHRFGSSINTDASRHVLKVFITPSFSYCQPVWCHVGKDDHVLLRATRVVLHDKAAVLGGSTHSTTEILPFNLLSKIQCLPSVYHLIQRKDDADY